MTTTTQTALERATVALAGVPTFRARTSGTSHALRGTTVRGGVVWNVAYCGAQTATLAHNSGQHPADCGRCLGRAASL